jgi:hypothetical protein
MGAAKVAKSLLPKLLGVVGAGQMGAGIAQVRWVGWRGGASRK